MFLHPGGKATRPRAGNLIARNVYTSSNSKLVIPRGVTKAFVILVGAGADGSGSGAVGSAGGFLFKLLTNLTPGNTLNLTVGAHGSPGGASTLSSGTQVISTLTANGGTQIFLVGNVQTGGTASGGDLNCTGGTAAMVRYVDATFTSVVQGGLGGNSLFGGAGQNINTNGTASDAPGAGAGGGSGGTSGGNGVCIIDWLS